MEIRGNTQQVKRLKELGSSTGPCPCLLYIHINVTAMGASGRLLYKVAIKFGIAIICNVLFKIYLVHIF